MRKNWKNNLIWLLVLLLPFSFTACTDKPENAEGTAAADLEYTCPMHPQIVREEPGACPICGMDLVPIQTAATPTVATSTDLDYLLQPTSQAVVSTINTIQPVRKKVLNDVAMDGVVTYDTRRQYIIPARFGGRIEKLYVQFNYQPVRKGQKLYEIYSPELVTAQKELLYLLQNDASNTALIQGAKQKLRLLGATEGQINQLTRTGRATYTFTVYSPYSGYVLDPAITDAPAGTPVPTAQTTPGDGMGGMGGAAGGSGAGNNAGAAASNPGGGFAIREGMYVTTGQTLLKVIDASQVWAQFNVASDLAAQLSVGMPVTVAFSQLPDKAVPSQITLIEPIFRAGENFVQVRASLPAQNNLTLIGQLITGKTAYSTGTGLWVPKEAVLDLGTQSVAFLKGNGVFKPIGIRVGQRADGLVEVLSGLDTQDVIAANAQFLVDSESFIQVEARNR